MQPFRARLSLFSFPCRQCILSHVSYTISWYASLMFMVGITFVMVFSDASACRWNAERPLYDDISVLCNIIGSNLVSCLWFPVRMRCVLQKSFWSPCSSRSSCLYVCSRSEFWMTCLDQTWTRMCNCHALHKKLVTLTLFAFTEGTSLES